MTKFEEWKGEEIENVKGMTIDDFIFQVVNERYPTCCDYCIYYYEKIQNKNKEKIKCGKCSDGIRAYLEKEV